MYATVPGKIAVALAANGATDGYATLASNTGFYPGMRGFIFDDNGQQAVLLTDLSGATKIGLRFVVEDTLGTQDPKQQTGSPVRRGQTAGRSPLDAYTTANHAKVTFPTQVVPVTQPAFSADLGFTG